MAPVVEAHSPNHWATTGTFFFLIFYAYSEFHQPQNAGYSQESVLSPVLFAIFTHSLIDHM